MDPLASAWLAAAHQALGPASVGGYLHYPAAGQPPTRYLGPNGQRFNAIRWWYDRGGVMRSGIAG